jgi:hypothetical protein
VTAVVGVTICAENGSLGFDWGWILAECFSFDGVVGISWTG